MGTLICGFQRPNKVCESTFFKREWLYTRHHSFGVDLGCPHCNHPLTLAHLLHRCTAVVSHALRWEWWLEPVLELEPLHQKILHVGRCTAQVHAALKKLRPQVHYDVAWVSSL